MHIVNAMFGRGLGGIEQAFFDYAECLLNEGNDVTVMLRPDSAMLPQIEALKKKHPTFRVVTISNFGFWDLLAALRLKRKLQLLKADVIITHGNRAAELLRKAAGKKIPVISLAHNYSLKRLIGSDAVFAITEDIAKALIKEGQPKDSVFVVPNMIRAPKNIGPHTPFFREPPVIGSMGRFVEKKGFANYINALSHLKERNVPFRAVLGGTGDEEANLKALAKEKGLEEQLKFIGWVKDKRAFFESIDIFCLPSLHEPFGIVLLEAFAHAVPVVTTDSEGPSEIAKHGRDAFVVPKADPKAMAESIATFMRDAIAAERIALGGLETVKTRYDMEVVGKKIDEILHQIVSLNRRAA